KRPLWGGSAVRGRLQSVREAALRQFDLEFVLALRLRVAQRGLGGLAETCRTRGLPGERRFRLVGSPRFGTDPTKCDTHITDVSACKTHDDGGRGKSEFVRGSIAQLQIDMPASFLWWGQRDVCDEVARFKHSLAMRCVAGQEMKIADGNRPRAARPLHM